MFKNLKITKLVFAFTGMAGFITEPQSVCQHIGRPVFARRHPRHMVFALIKGVHPLFKPFMPGFKAAHPFLKELGILIA